MITATRKDAYRLLHDSALMLAKVEANGIRIDTEYLKKAIVETDKRIKAAEDELREDKIFNTWRNAFGGKVNLHAPQQFRRVLNLLGYKPEVLDKKGGRKGSVTAKALEDLNLPFAKKWTKMQSIAHTKTSLTGLQREEVDGLFHPNYNFNPISYRSASGADKEEFSNSDYNAQNTAARNQENSKIIRTAFIPREGNNIIEADFKVLEGMIGTTYHQDPRMMHYWQNPESDMHRDTAQKMFFLNKSQVMEMRKTVRDCAKNGVVFPLFYGSVFFQCAPAVWNRMCREKWVIPGTDMTVKRHLRKHGIKELGSCDKDTPPEPGTFADHIKKIERLIWDKMFPGYRDWRKQVYSDYLDTGYFDYHTGFRIKGYYRRNQVISLPIQGTSFHCLLWTLIELQKWLERKRMRTRIIGQIHDSGLIDSPKRETMSVAKKLLDLVIVDLPKAWKWINVPLQLELEYSDENWFQKHPLKVA